MKILTMKNIMVHRHIIIYQYLQNRFLYILIKTAKGVLLLMNKNTKFSDSEKTDIVLKYYSNVKFNGTLIGNSTVHRKFIQNSDTGCWVSLCNVCSVTLFLRIDRVKQERISRIPAKVCTDSVY